MIKLLINLTLLIFLISCQQQGINKVSKLLDDDVKDNISKTKNSNLNNDLEGIMWIRDNIPGSPVIAEATTEPHRYMWGNRISIYTGNPTVIGWGWHQTQQRTSRESIEEINTRIQDVKVFFSTENKKLAQDIAEKYTIEYIYVGELEKIYYPKEGLDKFDFMIQQGFKKIYYKNGFSVYKIKKP